MLVSQHNPALQDISESLSNSLDRGGSGGMRAALNMGGNKITNLGPGVNPTDAATVAQAGTGSVPAGVVMDFAGAAAPTGYLMCYGQEVDRTAYSLLFAAIGTTYGAGNGTTTFNLPDARGRVTAGKDDMGGTAAGRLTAAVVGAGLGAAGGEESHTLTTAEIPAHTHTGATASAGDHTHLVDEGSFGGGGGGSLTSGDDYTNVVANQSTTSVAGAHTHTLTIDSSGGGGGAHNITQPTIVFNKIIRTGI